MVAWTMRVPKMQSASMRSLQKQVVLVRAVRVGSVNIVRIRFMIVRQIHVKVTICVWQVRIWVITTMHVVTSMSALVWARIALLSGTMQAAAAAAAVAVVVAAAAAAAVAVVAVVVAAVVASPQRYMANRIQVVAFIVISADGIMAVISSFSNSGAQTDP